MVTSNCTEKCQDCVHIFSSRDRPSPTVLFEQLENTRQSEAHTSAKGRTVSA